MFQPTCGSPVDSVASTRTPSPLRVKSWASEKQHGEAPGVCRIPKGFALKGCALYPPGIGSPPRQNAPPSAARSRPRFRGRSQLLLVAALLAVVLLATGGLRVAPWGRREGGAIAPGAQAEEAEDEVPGSREYLKAGSVYQNAYMTLWNANEVAISVTLRIQSSERFELKVSHLDSKGGGNDGWFAFKGIFQTARMPGSNHLRTLLPQPQGHQSKAFIYDPTVLDRPTAFLYKCLQRAGTKAFLTAMRLEVDIEKDEVRVTPVNSLVRMLWAEPVTLRRTTEAKLWVPKPGA